MFGNMAEDYVLHYLAGNAGEGDGPVVRWVTFVTRLVNWRERRACFHCVGIVPAL